MLHLSFTSNRTYITENFKFHHNFWRQKVSRSKESNQRRSLKNNKASTYRQTKPAHQKFKKLRFL